MKKSHGEVKLINGKRVATPEYRSWQMMKNRCLNPNATDYRYYGGRGVKIDSDWLRYESFLLAMGRRPSARHTLERKDSNGDYCKANCCWATRAAQARNRDYVVLSKKKAATIRRLYATGNLFQHEIAARFGVSQTLVSLITRNAAWKESAA